ncbi:MAG TPA: hypothetical protein VGT05_01235 [Patescibacteria group bacterium]|nr:hypothetical protein [Patescibacteria group bacterium]
MKPEHFLKEGNGKEFLEHAGIFLIVFAGISWLIKKISDKITSREGARARRTSG